MPFHEARSWKSHFLATDKQVDNRIRGTKLKHAVRKDLLETILRERHMRDTQFSFETSEGAGVLRQYEKGNGALNIQTQHSQTLKLSVCTSG